VLLLVPALASARSPAAAGERLADALIPGVPHVTQRPDFCGEACAEMWLRKLGKDATQDDVFALSGLDPALGRGVNTDELARALRRMGFEVGPVWYPVDPARGAQGVAEQFRALHADLVRGVPSIICGHFSDAPGASEHFRLVLGYDAAEDDVLYHEPAEKGAGYRRMKRALFLKLWTFKPRSDRWTLIRLRLEPGNVEAPRDGERPGRGGRRPARDGASREDGR
jgi:hypothetical protein